MNVLMSTNFSYVNDSNFDSINVESINTTGSLVIPTEANSSVPTSYTKTGALAIDKADETLMFSNGVEWITMTSGVNAGTGITVTGNPNPTVSISNIANVEGSYTSPSTINVNGQGQIIGIMGGTAPPTPATTQLVYVNMGGSDITGNGSLAYPYLTITHTISTITDALWEKRYIINVGPGNWNESFSMKAWTFLCCDGGASMAARILGTVDINDPSWAVVGSHSDERGGFANITFAGTVNMDFTAQSSLYGKVYFWNCNCNTALNTTAFGDVNQLSIFGGEWFGGLNETGGNVIVANVSGLGGTFNLASEAASPTLFAVFSSPMQGNLVATYSTGQAISITLDQSYITGGISLSGSNVSLTATGDSLPPLSLISLTGGATLTYANDAFGLAYTPTTPSNWAGNPTSLQNAIDRLSNSVATLLGHAIP